MELINVNQIPWSTLKPTEPGFYAYMPLSEMAEQIYPRVRLIVVEYINPGVSVGGYLVADCDDWDTFYHLTELDVGYWSKIQFQRL